MTEAIKLISSIFAFILILSLGMLQLTLYLGYRIKKTKHVKALNLFTLSVLFYFSCLAIGSLSGKGTTLSILLMNHSFILLRRILVILSTSYFIFTSWKK